jgi:hypothetical protein
VPEYFEDHAPYRAFIDKLQNSRAIDEGLQFLADRRQEAGDAQYTADHKGTPSYILGYAAFASHDYPSASLYFDAAVAADLTYHAGSQEFEPRMTNGRTARRSTITPHSAQAASAITIATGSGHFNVTQKVKHKTAPSIMVLPCAKFTVRDTACVT